MTDILYHINIKIKKVQDKKSMEIYSGPPKTFEVDKLMGVTIVNNGHIIKRSKQNIFSLRDQCKTKNTFKRSKYY
jgi:hypothetical protein